MSTPQKDDPASEWQADGDTVVELEPDDLDELDEAAARVRMDTPNTAPHHTLDWLAGYEAGLPEGERRGAARILAALRARLVQSGENREGAAHIAAVIAQMAGFRLH